MAITLQQFMATILINYNGVIGWSTTSMRLKVEEEVRETKKNMATEAAQVSGGSIVTSFPTATMP